MPAKPISIREFELALYEQAQSKCARKEDGSLVEIDLENALASLITIDVDKQKQKRAKEIISSLAKPGSTDPAGQLCIPGLDPYLYEPNRLVRNESGRVIENARAMVDFKQDEARRIREHAKDVSLWADRKTTEAERHAKWALAELLKGRPALELTWENCIKESGFWRDGEGDAAGDDKPRLPDQPEA